MSQNPRASLLPANELFEVLIRVALVGILSIACYQIFHPFLDLMLWSTILAVTLYPLHQWLTPYMANKSGWSAALLVLICLTILLLPISLTGTSLASAGEGLAIKFQAGGLHIPPPPESIAHWPLVGPHLSAYWQSAASNLSGLMGEAAPHLRSLIKPILSQLAGAGVAFLMFLGAIVIAGLMMAYGDSGARICGRIFARLAGAKRGQQLTELSTSTIRAVAQGVIGIAFIQALLLGAGFAVAGVPASGVLTVILLVLGIAQLPIMLVSVPVLIYMFTSDMSTLGFIGFAAYTGVASMTDSILKPLLLGRGVAVPMPVILLGAIGGLLTSGIIGLFVGPVTLALGYALFMSWVDTQDNSAEPDEDPELQGRSADIAVD